MRKALYTTRPECTQEPEQAHREVPRGGRSACAREHGGSEQPSESTDAPLPKDIDRSKERLEPLLGCIATPSPSTNSSKPNPSSKHTHRKYICNESDEFDYPLPAPSQPPNAPNCARNFRTFRTAGALALARGVVSVAMGTRSESAGPAGSHVTSGTSARGRRVGSSHDVL